MAKYILSIMNMIEILFMDIESLQTKDWDNFLSSLRLVMPWMVIYDNKNYSQSLPVFWMEMSSLSRECCQLIKEIFSQSLTGKAYSSLPPDLWRVHYEQGFKVEARVEKVTKEWNRPIYSMRNINNISTVKHFLENQQMPLKVKINKKIMWNLICE